MARPGTPTQTGTEDGHALWVWQCTDRLDCTYGQMGIVKHNAGTLGVSWVTNGAPNMFRIAEDDHRHEWWTLMRCEPPNRGTFPSCLFTPLVERHMILVDHQRSIRQICRSPYIEAAISLPLVGMTDVKADRYHCSSCARNRCAIVPCRHSPRKNPQ